MRIQFEGCNRLSSGYKSFTSSVFSYQSLEKSLGFTRELPVSENWSAAPDFLKIISDYCLGNQPQIIVECSSGTSSIVLAQCCQLNKCGHVYSLENGSEFQEQTREYLVNYRLENYNDVIYAPLHEYTLNNDTCQWYDVSRLPDVEIDMLVVDGPPGFIQKNSRYPAMPLLYELLAIHCVIFLDDASRADEKKIVDLWLQHYPEFSAEYVDNERGCAILTR